MFDFLSPFFGLGGELIAWALAAIFLVHGFAKLRNPGNIANVWGGSRAAGRVHGLVEVLAAVAVALNVYSSWGLAAMCIIMLGAIYFKAFRWHTGFMGKQGAGWEFDMLILVASFALLVG